MKFLIICLLFLGTVLGGCASPGTNPPMTALSRNVAAVQYGVVLQPTGNKLRVDTGPRGWEKNGKKDGYVGFAPGESGLLTFGLRSEDVDSVCIDDTPTTSARWVITKIELSATGDPVTEQGTNFGNDQSAYPWLKEAFPGVDLTNGHLFFAGDKYEGRGVVTIFSANQQQQDTLAYYRVTATNCRDGDTVDTDPSIRNGGR